MNLTVEDKRKILLDNGIRININDEDSDYIKYGKKLYILQTYTVLFDEKNKLKDLIYSHKGNSHIVKLLAKELPIKEETKLDEAVSLLIGRRHNEENVYVNYNGVKLYSLDVSIDSAYMQVYGKTKKECIDSGSNYALYYVDNIDKVVSLTLDAEKLLDSELLNKWRDFVEYNFKVFITFPTILEEIIKRIEVIVKDDSNVLIANELISEELNQLSVRFSEIAYDYKPKNSMNLLK